MQDAIETHPAPAKNKSIPYLPAKYENAFEWASAWIQENGMTLPPNTEEYSRLRNWFSFKLNQYKKKQLGPENEALLAHYGIDFGKYEAPQTGRPRDVSDIALVEMLRSYKEAHGKYHLGSDAPQELVDWHKALIVRYMHIGTTGRMRDIQRKLPDLHFGTWMGPKDTPLTSTERQWWAQADEYEQVSQEFPACDGVQHPDMPSRLMLWAVNQIKLERQGLLPRRARGWMRGLGLLAKAACDQPRGRKHPENRSDEHLHKVGMQETRLNKLRGALSFIEMTQAGADPKRMLIRFDLNPVFLKILQDMVQIQAPKRFWSDVTYATRAIALKYPDAFAPQWWTLSTVDVEDRPTLRKDQVAALGNLAYAVTQRYQELLTIPKPQPPVFREDTDQPALPRSQWVFKDYAKELLAIEKAKTSESNYKGVSSKVNRWIIPHIGNSSPIELDAILLGRMLTKMEQENTDAGTTPSKLTIKHIRTIAIRFVNYARQDRGLPVIDHSSVMVGKGYQRQRDADPFSKDEAYSMLKLVRQDYANVLQAVLFSGLNVNQILELKRSDVNKEATALRNHIGTDHAWYPVDYKMQSGLIAEMNRQSNPDGPLYCTRRMKPIDNGNFGSHLLRELQEYAGIRQRNIKNFRYTAVMFWLSEGKTMEWISGLTGLTVKTLKNQFLPLMGEFLAVG